MYVYHSCVSFGSVIYVCISFIRVIEGVIYVCISFMRVIEGVIYVCISIMRVIECVIYVCIEGVICMYFNHACH